MTRHVSTRRDRLTDHPMRAAIVALVRDAPGILLSQLRRRLGCSAGTLQYHLRMLEQHGFVVGQVSPRRHRIFPASMPPADRRALALLRSGRTGDVAAAIVRSPGSTPAALGAWLGLGRRALRLAVEPLAQEGLLLVGAGPACYWPSPALLRLLGAPAAQGLPARVDLADSLRAADPLPADPSPAPQASPVLLAGPGRP